MKLIEVFNSIQGEGSHIGWPTTFIRLAGCNLACKWCDTQGLMQQKPIERTVEQVVEMAKALTLLRHVCITGGEPLLQASEVRKLCELIHEEFPLAEIEIETNGTYKTDQLQSLFYVTICADLKTPSSGEESNSDVLLHLRPGDTIKAVVKTEDDFRYAMGSFKFLRNFGCEAEMQISVEDGQYAKRVAEMSHNIRVLVQMHKVLELR